MNETIRRFGYPATLIREYPDWVVLLRPRQATLGALLVACKDEVLRLSDLPRPGGGHRPGDRQRNGLRFPIA